MEEYISAEVARDKNKSPLKSKDDLKLYAYSRHFKCLLLLNFTVNNIILHLFDIMNLVDYLYD